MKGGFREVNRAMNRSERLVIIGNSGAAISAIRSIRSVESSCPITLVSRESYPAYSPVLTTYYIGNRISWERLFLTDSKFYEALGVNTLLGREVTGLDIRSQRLQLSDGASLPFDRLLIATGASANRPRFDGANLDNVFTLRTVDDAQEIRSSSKTARDIVFIGAGLVSLQVASQLHRENLRMVFLVSSDRILSQNLDSVGASIVQHRIEKRGGTFLFNREVRGIEKNKERLIVTTSQNETIEGDVVFIGKGVKPNTGFVQKGLEINRGIWVNDRMQTSVETIFAAGDVTEGINPLTNRREVIANWPNACLQGRVAGLNMMGHEETFTDFVPKNVTQLFGLVIASVGRIEDAGPDREGELILSEPEREIYCRAFLQGKRMIGANLVGEINDIGLIHSAIQNGSPIQLNKEFLSKYLLSLDGPLTLFSERQL
jgi:NAD(P)H-nitrite reductase large subunit